MQTQVADPGANGQQRVRITPQSITSRNPITGDVLGQVSIATPLQIREAMAEARLGQGAWAGIGLERRLALLKGVRDALYRQQDRVVDTLVAEQGKVRQEALIEYFAAMEMVDYYLREAARILAPTPVSVRLIPHREHVIERRPFGVVAVISPWNFPLWLSTAPIMAALVAGNSVIYKPSEYATQIGEVIASALAEGSIPREVFQILHGYGDVGAALIKARPDKICLTGSAATGRKVAQAAGEQLIPVTLELGGKDAAIVLRDANIKRAAAGIVWGGMWNAGQTCCSIERVYVDRRIADRFVQALKEAVERYVRLEAGRGRERSLAAITTPEQIRIIEDHVGEALAGGARAVTGGGRLESAGRFFAPTILTDVAHDMRVMCEETFGPVIPVMTFEDETEAIRLANDSTYGLTASVWTRDRARALRLARQLQVGTVSINDHMVVSGVAELPWGGVKDSGYGRTQGEEGLLDMTYAQAFMVGHSARARGLWLETFWYPYNATKWNLLRRGIHLMFGPTWRDKLRGLLP